MAFRLINKNLQFPTLYPRVERKLRTAKEKGWDKVGGFLLREKVDYMPQPGLQETVCACEANVIYMCGAATMGKSFAGILMWGYRVDKKGSSGAMVSARLQDSKKGSSIFRDNELVWGPYGGCEYSSSDYPAFLWRQWYSAWRLIHSNFNTNNPAEWAQFVEYAKKNQNGYQYFDEANDLPEKQYHYWNSRNRDDSGMIPQSVYSFNPPEDRNHYFTRNLVNGGYIGEDWYFKPEMNGKVRYYYSPTESVDDIIWGDTPEEVAEAAHITLTDKDREAGLTETDMIRSFAAFTGEASDNRMLVASTGGKSVANLLYSGQGDSLKGGYFGGREKEGVNVNRQMILNLWENPIGDDENMYATLDVSRSIDDNSDDCPMAIWKGLQLIAIEMLRVDLKTLVRTIHDTLNRYNVPIEHFAFDASGIGEYLQDFTEGNPIKGNRRAIQEYDKYGNPVELERYFDLRSQLHGKAEAMLKRGEISCLVDKGKILRYGKKGTTRQLIDILFDEINVFITTDKNGKIYYRSKEEYKRKFKSSPDFMDVIVMRSFFELDARPKKQPQPTVPDNVYHKLYHRPKIVGGWGRYR